jgi:hypothetical protein
MSTIKACNFSCSCTRDDCSFEHRIDNIELRKEFKKIVDMKFDRNSHNETDPDGIRHVPCFHGHLCNNESCGFKHRCSYSGRVEIQNEWYMSHHSQRKRLTQDDVEKLKKLVDKYIMSHEESELINSFARVVRISKD